MTESQPVRRDDRQTANLVTVKRSLGPLLLLVVGAVVSSVVQSIPRWIGITAAAALVAAYLIVRNQASLRAKISELETHRDVGIARIYENYEAARPDLLDAISAAQHHVALIGISHRSHTGPGNSFFDALATFLAQRGSKLDIYILEPGCETVERRAGEEGDSVNAFNDDISGAIERWQGWSKGHGFEDAVSVRCYKEYPLWRMQIIDDSLIFVSPYPPGSVGTVAPELKLVPTQSPGSLFSGFKAVADELERSATLPPT